MFGARRFARNLRRQHHRDPALDAELRTEILLRSARVGADSVREDFVSSLHRRLATELGDGPGPVPLGRRTVIVRLGATAAASAALGAGLDHVLSPHVTPGVPEPEQQLSPDDGVWTTVAQSADLPEGSALRFDVGTVIGFVSRKGNQVSAVSGICTHLGCQLDLDAPAKTLNCPCHGASFAVTGAVVQHRLRVPLGPLPKIEVRELHGAIQVFAPSQ